MNQMKTFLLMFGLLLLLMFAGQLLGLKGPGMLMLLIGGMAFNLIMYWFSDKLVLASYGARELDAREFPQVARMVRNLTTKAGMPMPRLYIIDSEAPNAFATGRNPEHSVVAVTTGILRILPDEELEGVLAHELSHIKNRDMLISTLAAGIASAITYLAHFGMFFSGGRRDDDEGHGGNPLAAILLMVLAPLAAMLIQMAVSRSREYQADRSGGLLTGRPRALARALQRIHAGIAATEPLEGAKPETAHLMIESPFSGGGLMSLFSTHPSMESRVQKLAELETEMRGGTAF